MEYHTSMFSRQISSFDLSSSQEKFPGTDAFHNGPSLAEKLYELAEKKKEKKHRELWSKAAACFCFHCLGWIVLRFLVTLKCFQSLMGESGERNGALFKRFSESFASSAFLLPSGHVGHRPVADGG